jgi:hypothetical protein
MRIGNTDLILTAHGGILRASDGKMLQPDACGRSYGVTDAPVVGPGGLVASPAAGKPWDKLVKVELTDADSVKVTRVDAGRIGGSRWRSFAVYEGRFYAPIYSPPEVNRRAPRGKITTGGPYGCVIGADNKLFCPATSCGFSVYDISGTQPKFLANNSLEVSDQHFHGNPFAQGNRLYVRGPLYLWCLGDPAAPYHSPARPANLPAPVKSDVAAPGPDAGRRLEYEIKGEALFSMHPIAMSGRGGTWRILDPQVTAPKEGTPIATCAGKGLSPVRWLVAGPFPAGDVVSACEPKESFVGEFLVNDAPGDTPNSKIVPEPGVKVRFDGREQVFQPSKVEHYRNWKWVGSQVVTTLDAGKALGGRAGCLYLGASLRADGNVRVSYVIQRGAEKTGKPPEVIVWIGGVQYLEKATIRLRPGYYPLLVRVKPEQPISPEAECAVGLFFSHVPEDSWVSLHRETLDDVLRLCPDSEHAKKAKDVLDFDASCGVKEVRAELEVLASVQDLRTCAPDQIVSHADAIAKRGKEAVPPLMRMLDFANPRPAVRAALTLGKIGPAAQEAVPALKVILAKTDAELRAKTAKELEGHDERHYRLDLEALKGTIEAALKEIEKAP